MDVLRKSMTDKHAFFKCVKKYCLHPCASDQIRNVSALNVLVSLANVWHFTVVIGLNHIESTNLLTYCLSTLVETTDCIADESKIELPSKSVQMRISTNI